MLPSQLLFVGWRFVLKGAFHLPGPARAELEDIISSLGAEVAAQGEPGLLRSDAARFVIISDSSSSAGTGGESPNCPCCSPPSPIYCVHRPSLQLYALGTGAKCVFVHATHRTTLKLR
jgi:hypothetical protein